MTKSRFLRAVHARATTFRSILSAMMRDYCIPQMGNILCNLALRDLENYPINHYYRGALFNPQKSTEITSAPRHIHHIGKRSDNAPSLFRVAHAMRDHSVYDTYGV